MVSTIYIFALFAFLRGHFLKIRPRIARIYTDEERFFRAASARQRPIRDHQFMSYGDERIH